MSPCRSDYIFTLFPKIDRVPAAWIGLPTYSLTR
nr:MAG TPA: hypothetical protein [Caudoviricetes sp.]